MATIEYRNPENVPGAYYVDDTCIDCDTCRSIAPSIFTREDNRGYSIVHKQPQTPDEIALAEEALQACPTESIGNDAEPEAHSNG